MLNDFEALANALLDESQSTWLVSELAYVRTLADRHADNPWAHHIVCDNYWLGFDRELGGKNWKEGWRRAEWIVAREWVRTAIRESFSDVGQWVDEHPLTDWQVAEVEDAYLQARTPQATAPASARRL